MTPSPEPPRHGPHQPRGNGPPGHPAATIDKTLAPWEGFLAKQPGCDSGFVAAPGQAMRAINVSSAAQVPMIMRELLRGDGSIRINFPANSDPQITEDQVKIRAFVRDHHGQDLASLKSELVTLLADCHSFKKLLVNPKFQRAFGSAEKWVDVNFSGVTADGPTLAVTDVVSLQNNCKDQISGAIVSLQESFSSGRRVIFTVPINAAQDQSFRDTVKDEMRAKLAEARAMDISTVRVWIGATSGGVSKRQLACQGVRELSLTDFLASAEVGREANTPPKEASVAAGLYSEPLGGDSLGGLLVESEASTVARQAAALTEATAPEIGVAVDNHRKGHDQEDRNLACSCPAMSREKALDFLRRAVAAMNGATAANPSGSTFTGVIVTNDGNLVTANLGDSPASAIIIRQDGTVKEVVPLTAQHKPGNHEGTSPSGLTFSDSGGYRSVAGIGVIGMTHALGDVRFADTISRTPFLQAHQIQGRLNEGDRVLLLVTTDGAHNEDINITHTLHADTIARLVVNGSDLVDISKQIARDSAGIRDNVTVMLYEVERNQSGDEGVMLAVFDGHGGIDTAEQARWVMKQLTNRLHHIDSSATLAEVATRVTLEGTLLSLKKQLHDARKLKGNFVKGAKLANEEQEIQNGLVLVAQMRESFFKRDEESCDKLRPQLLVIHDKCGINGDEIPTETGEQLLDFYEKKLNHQLRRKQAEINLFVANILLPAINGIVDKIAAIEKVIDTNDSDRHR